MSTVNESPGRGDGGKIVSPEGVWSANGAAYPKSRVRVDDLSLELHVQSSEKPTVQANTDDGQCMINDRNVARSPIRRHVEDSPVTPDTAHSYNGNCLSSRVKQVHGDLAVETMVALEASPAMNVSSQEQCSPTSPQQMDFNEMPENVSNVGISCSADCSDTVDLWTSGADEQRAIWISGLVGEQSEPSAEDCRQLPQEDFSLGLPLQQEKQSLQELLREMDQRVAALSEEPSALCTSPHSNRISREVGDSNAADTMLQVSFSVSDATEDANSCASSSWPLLEEEDKLILGEISSEIQQLRVGVTKDWNSCATPAEQQVYVNHQKKLKTAVEAIRAARTSNLRPQLPFQMQEDSSLVSVLEEFVIDYLEECEAGARSLRESSERELELKQAMEESSAKVASLRHEVAHLEEAAEAAEAHAAREAARRASTASFATAEDNESCGSSDGMVQGNQKGSFRDCSTNSRGRQSPQAVRGRGSSQGPAASRELSHLRRENVSLDHMVTKLQEQVAMEKQCAKEAQELFREELAASQQRIVESPNVDTFCESETSEVLLIQVKELEVALEKETEALAHERKRRSSATEESARAFAAERKAFTNAEEYQEQLVALEQANGCGNTRTAEVRSECLARENALLHRRLRQALAECGASPPQHGSPARNRSSSFGDGMDSSLKVDNTEDCEEKDQLRKTLQEAVSERDNLTSSNLELQEELAQLRKAFAKPSTQEVMEDFAKVETSLPRRRDCTRPSEGDLLFPVHTNHEHLGTWQTYEERSSSVTITQDPVALSPLSLHKSTNNKTQAATTHAGHEQRHMMCGESAVDESVLEANPTKSKDVALSTDDLGILALNAGDVSSCSKHGSPSSQQEELACLAEALVSQECVTQLGNDGEVNADSAAASLRLIQMRNASIENQLLQYLRQQAADDAEDVEEDLKEFATPAHIMTDAGVSLAQHLARRNDLFCKRKEELQDQYKAIMAEQKAMEHVRVNGGLECHAHAESASSTFDIRIVFERLSEHHKLAQEVAHLKDRNLEAECAALHAAERLRGDSNFPARMQLAAQPCDAYPTGGYVHDRAEDMWQQIVGSQESQERLAGARRTQEAREEAEAVARDVSSAARAAALWEDSDSETDVPKLPNLDALARHVRVIDRCMTFEPFGVNMADLLASPRSDK
eukprot:gnl/MRDRNA2_/MRDRNA2_74262_c0_seq1.p1 gnl/MRDRNA2_/MRDRNA2_74262_c0~~gnl/MRDRNA2_/MRDRNA2_74262_c0_seq1.p1  ORF type:complete len:1304 (-),score=304.32 gnl/MRDRNA2_/MRDRNA2_74262_c0_seq1:16-3513(-)